MQPTPGKITHAHIDIAHASQVQGIIEPFSEVRLCLRVDED